MANFIPGHFPFLDIRHKRVTDMKNSRKSIRWSAYQCPTKVVSDSGWGMVQGSGLEGVNDLFFLTYEEFSPPSPPPQGCPEVGKEVCSTLQRFTIKIFGLYVEKHDVSSYFKFQDNRINSLEVTAFQILKK